MSLKWAPVVILLAGGAMVAFGLWRRMQDPPRTVSTGSFQFSDRHGTVLIFPQRVVAVAGFQKTEVQLPGGTWIDCRGDCAQAIREEYSEIWDQKMLKGR